MTGSAEVGLPAVLLGVTALLAALSSLLSPARVVLIAIYNGPTVTAPAAAVALGTVALGAAALGLARRWAHLASSRRPAALMLGHAHTVAWAGLLTAVWLLAYHDATGVVTRLGIVAYALGNLTGWVATRDRPQTVPAPVLPPLHPGQAVAWTGHARLSADVAAPLVVFFVVVVGPATAASLYSGAASILSLLGPVVAILLVYNGQLRALWVTVTVGGNGVRIRTGPFGRVIHRSWDQIGAVEVPDEELPPDSLLWARRFERRYVLRPGPALRLRQRELHLPAITVSIDHADQAAAIAARHLADHTHPR